MKLKLSMGFAALLVSCSSSTPSPPSSGGDGGGDSGGTSASCSAAGVTALAELPVECAGLASSVDSLFTVDVRRGTDTPLGKSGVVLRVPKDGAAVSDIYTPDGPRKVQSIGADRTDLFVAEFDPAASNEKSGRLSRKTLASGAVSSVLATGIDKTFSSIVAVDETHVYVAQPSTRSGVFGIYRVAKAGGSLETVVEVDSGAFTNVRLLGDEFSFVAGVTNLYRVSKNNGGAAATSVASRTCTNGLATTPDAVYCGQPLELEKAGPLLESPQVLFRVDDVPYLDTAGASGPQPRLVTEDAVYVHFNPGANKLVPVVRVERATGAYRPVMCEVGWVGGLVVDEQLLYVLQVRDEKFESKSVLYKGPR